MADAAAASLSASPTPSPPSRLDILGPVRTLFLPFLADGDAARLLRVGRSTAFALLPGFTFRRHVFQLADMEEVRRMQALHARYDLRPTRLRVPAGLRWNGSTTGPSPFPSSLTALLFAPDAEDLDDAPERPLPDLFDADYSTVAGTTHCPWTELLCLWHSEASAEAEDEAMSRLLTRDDGFSVAVRPFFTPDVGFCRSALPIGLGLFPHGLRRLQISADVVSPWQAGSLPPTLEALQIDGEVLHPFQCGALPRSLVRLVAQRYDFPIPPGVLPSSLEQLRLDRWNQPLHVGALPTSLRALQLGAHTHPLLPGVLPAGLTHLTLGGSRREVREGELPPCLFSLDLRLAYNWRHTLRPLVLPASLRVLGLHTRGERPLVAGLLPNGLQVLRWAHEGEPVDLLPGQLPSSLQVLDIVDCSVGHIAASAIPASVRLLRLPKWYDVSLDLLGLSQQTTVRFES